MTPPLTPEERRAEFFAAHAHGEYLPELVPVVIWPPCPICGLPVTEHWGWPGYRWCEPCGLTWKPDGSVPRIEWDDVESNPDHPLWTPSVEDVDTGGRL